MQLDALESPVDKKDAKAFLEQHPVKKTFFTFSRDVTSTLVVLVLIGGVVSYSLLQGSGTAAIIFACIVLLIIAISIPSFFYYHHVYALKNAEIGLRVERMAQSNGWQYTHKLIDSKQSTTFFTAGRDYVYTNVVTAPDFEAGQFEYTTGHGRDEHKFYYGYMIVPLQRSLPHMLLDGKSNNLKAFGKDISNIATSFDKNQIDLLEGDFNDHYTLYAPEGYSIDVRYIFTPDLMNTLVEESDNIDIEILDNNVFVYFGKRNIESRQFWEKVGRLREAFTDKLVRKSLRYEDDRSVDGAVATEGRRLKKKASMFGIIFVLIVIISQVMSVIVRLSTE